MLPPRQSLALSLLLLALGLVLPQTITAQTFLMIDEEKTQFRLRRDPEAALFIENSTSGTIKTKIEVKLTDPRGGLRAQAEREALVHPGRAGYAVTVPEFKVESLSESERRDLLWYRLAVRLTPLDAPGNSIEGVVSLSKVTRDFFQLNVAASGAAKKSGLYRVRVRAEHPLTSRPVENVEIEAALGFDGAETLRAAAQTDADGYAAFVFQLPSSINGREGELEIVGRLGQLVARAEENIWVDRQALISINTDKTIYQPGQKLHARALFFDSGRRALAGLIATLKIVDPEGIVQFRAPLKTSRFGVAAADWQIPGNLRLGDYDVKVEIGEGEFADSEAKRTIKISRYELPEFVVNVKPDRPYYLPGQNANVEVSADYLFGRPVRQGSIRVVRESEPEWNFREQRWDHEVEEEYRGQTDGHGRLRANIKLAAAHRDFAEEKNGDAPYEDFSYVAYFTDHTTNRTEQRRFDLRVTKDEIHIYVAEDGYSVLGHPSHLYLSAYYADGAPASCELTISNAGRKPKNAAGTAGILRKIKTNTYGVAKVSDLRLFPVIVGENDESNNVELVIRARDGRGLRGQRRHSFWLSRGPGLRVETDKPLYRQGEPITATILSTDQATAAVVVEVANRTKLLRTEILPLSAGRGTLEIPYQKEFTGRVTVAAYSGAEMTPVSIPFGSRSVLYPRDESLRLEASLSKPVFRPGEEVEVALQARVAGQLPSESALGITINDKAVQERIRTEGNSSRDDLNNDPAHMWGGNAQISGVTRQDLDRLDFTRPLSPGLDLVAEMLLMREGGELYPVFFGDNNYTESDNAFSELIKPQSAQIANALSAQYMRGLVYPRRVEDLQRILGEAGVTFASLRDPWGRPYRARFGLIAERETLDIISDGPDEVGGTSDDFVLYHNGWPYFRPVGEIIDRAQRRFHSGTKRFVRSYATLAAELRRDRINLNALRDQWGKPYRVEFRVETTTFTTLIKSSGPDQRWMSDDDFTIWRDSLDYFIAERRQIEQALHQITLANKQYPQNEQTLRGALKNHGIDLSRLRDPWHRPYYAAFSNEARYADHATIVSRAKFGEKPKDVTTITPITQRVMRIGLRSAGRDGKRGTPDDFSVAAFSHTVSEQSAKNRSPRPPRLILTSLQGECALSGTVTDAAGAVIPGAVVSVTQAATRQVSETQTDENGAFLLRRLAAGEYEVQISAPGFKVALLTEVRLTQTQITELNAVLEAGATTETVTVTAEAVALQTETSQSSLTVLTGRKFQQLPTLKAGTAGKTNNSLSTPRLREYFPETLLWRPEVVTEGNGRARIKFPLADNITTWKMSVIGSTVNGEIGTLEKDIPAFQPFFVEHHPPPVLTQGDEIALPVVLRNYLNRTQTVNVEIKPESWYKLLGPASKSVRVLAGEAARETFDLMAVESVKDGRQRVIALGVQEASDAVEKSVSVHPDGEDVAVTTAQILREFVSTSVDLPAEALPRTARAELKIYPNLMSHVMEGVEAVMSRPYGCGEQTISSAYPSLLLLRYYQSRRVGEGELPETARRAKRYVQLGYERLLSYRAQSGGFSYWGRGEADLSLTAYALRFLHDAKAVIDVDEEIAQEARAWLFKQQRQDGSWPAYEYHGEGKRRTALVTAFITRVLVAEKATARAEAGASPTPHAAALERAFDYLSHRSAEIDEPYLIASYALAAQNGGKPEQAHRAVDKLKSLVREENQGNYWALETNTPFYGWGLAGRIETTALAVQALAHERGQASAGKSSAPKNNQGGAEATELDAMVDRGLLFLMRHKDRHGVWLSTQATINVLDALTSLIPADQIRFVPTGVDSKVEILVNGQRAQTLIMPPNDNLTNPLTVDLSAFINSGKNRVEIQTVGGDAPRQAAQTQIVTTYYVPWSQARTAPVEGSRQLRLMVSFDHTRAVVNQEITCRVEVERVGFKGYGMLLAEIGLPPGAEVDRASLNEAMNASQGGLNRYDVLPDRLIVYLWPQSGGTKFQFKFRPRYGIKALTAPSVVYDYYNPEAREVLAPTKFVVKD